MVLLLHIKHILGEVEPENQNLLNCMSSRNNYFYNEELFHAVSYLYKKNATVPIFLSFFIILSYIHTYMHAYIQLHLKGHCHTDFAVFWSKYTKYMTNYLCSNIKLLLEHQEDNIK